MKTQLDLYVQALIPETYIILGLKLRPFCLGHFFLMRRYDCKFSSEDPNANGDISDLILALSICCRTYEQFITFVNDKELFYSWTKDWGKKVVKLLKSKKVDMFETFQLFKTYMRDSVVVPKYWNEKEEDTATSGAHWSQSVLSTLTSDCGYTQSIC